MIFMTFGCINESWMFESYWKTPEPLMNLQRVGGWTECEERERMGAAKKKKEKNTSKQPAWPTATIVESGWWTNDSCSFEWISQKDSKSEFLF